MLRCIISSDLLTAFRRESWGFSQDSPTPGFILRNATDEIEGPAALQLPPRDRTD